MRRFRLAVLAVTLTGSGWVNVWAGTADVTITSTPSNVFTPQIVTVRIGDTVRWTNVAGFHNVLSDALLFTSGSAATAPFTFSQTFTTPGSFGYYCQPHGGPGVGQFGTIVVLSGAELTHGADQTEDLDAGLDLYRLGQKPFESYEVIVDSTAGNPALLLDRMDAAATTVLQAGIPVTAAIGHSRSLRFENATASSVDDQRVRVSCPSCSVNDSYRIRVRETTLTVPRFNQSGTQTTILILQNTTDTTITGHVYFWSAAGTLLNAGGALFSVAAHGAVVLSAGSVPGVPGQSGTATITHDGRYGGLSGKAVALEPSTGFTFDTPVLPRPH